MKIEKLPQSPPTILKLLQKQAIPSSLISVPCPFSIKIQHLGTPQPLNYTLLTFTAQTPNHSSAAPPKPFQNQSRPTSKIILPQKGPKVHPNSSKRFEMIKAALEPPTNTVSHLLPATLHPCLLFILAVPPLRIIQIRVFAKFVFSA